MKILNKVSIKNLKLNKKRTVSTIIGIILSVSLICAVATMFASFQKTLVQNAINESGYYHLELENITDENIKELKNNRDIKKLNFVTQNGYAKLEGGQNENKPYLCLFSMNKVTFEDLSFNLIKGRFPDNNNEIVISEHINNNAKVDYKIGDKIKLDVGKRKSLDNVELSSYNPYYAENEKLVNTINKEFTIVGFIERPAYNFENYSAPGYTIITTNMNDGIKSTYISLKDPRGYKNSISEILGAKDYNEVKSGAAISKYEDYSINEELLRWEVFAFSDSTITMLYAVIAVVIFIIIFTSVFCIRNSFAIAVTEKIKMYSMLASVGATRRQIKRNVIFEAIIIGLIGIPLGILAGIFAVFVLIKIVNALIGEYMLGYVDGIILKVSIMPILLSIVLGIVTIYLSAISSARKASKITPIEGLRSSDEIKIKNKKLKTPKIISKIFKTGGVLAYKNLKRSKKKYKTTVISITVSIFIFITMNSFITNVFDFAGDYYEDYDYNIRIYGNRETWSEERIKQITSLNNIDEYFVLYEGKENYIKIKDLSKINPESIEKSGIDEEQYYDETKNEIVTTGEGKISRLEIKALNHEAFKKYVDKIGADYEKVKTSGILCDKYQYYSDSLGNSKEIRRYTYKENETINGKYNGEEINIKVGAVTDIRPYGLEKTYYYGGYLIVDVDEYKNIEFIVDLITINSSNADALEEEIKKSDNDISDTMIRNMDAEVKEERSMILVINIFLYGFITVITLIGVTNIFNTITSNMELRQKEFAMLKSIGMTKKEFNRMINLETIFYGTKALIYGITLGLLGTYALYKSFSVKFDKGMYIPTKPILISIVAVFVLISVIMKYSIKKINNQNTIETIRKENI